MERIDKVKLQFEIDQQRKGDALEKMNEDLSKQQKLVSDLEKQKKQAEKKNRKNPEAEEVKRLTAEYEKEKAKLEELERKKNDYINTTKMQSMNLRQLQDELKHYNMILANLTPGSEAFLKTQGYVIELRSRIKELRMGAVETKQSLFSMADSFNSISFAAINFLSLKDRFVSWAQPFVDEARKMSDVTANVAKYTGQTIAEVERMNEKLSQIDTRTSVEQLDELAGAAGRLGITGERDIIGFVDAADKINTALGDDLGEGAIDAIGKMVMVFGEDKTKGLNGAMLATGSALNVLGASSSANTGYIANFTSKLAAVATQARISQTDIMGYASALSQAGEEGETAAGVLTQFLVKMFSDPSKFAKAAKLDVQDFTKLIRTDANQAVLTFLDSMKKAGGFEQLAPMLKSLKMQGTQAVPVLTELANGLDNVSEAQRTAREAYEEGTSIIDEFNTVNETAQARLEKTEKRLATARKELGEKLLPVVETLEESGIAGINTLSAVVSGIVAVRGPLTTLTVALSAYALVQGVAYANSKKQLAIDALHNAKRAISATLINAKTVATAAYNLVIAKVTGNTERATLAQTKLNAAMSANVIGAIAAAAVVLISVLKSVYTEVTKVSEATKALNDAQRESKKRVMEEQVEMDRLVDTVKDANASETQRKEALEAINGKLMEQHLGNLTEEEIRTGKAEGKLREYNRQLMIEIENEILLGKLKEARAKQMDAENGEFDMSFLDQVKRAYISLLGFSAKGFSGAKKAWQASTKYFQQEAIDEQQEAIGSIQKQMKENDRKRNEIHFIDDVVVTPGGKETDDPSSTTPYTNEDDKKKTKKDHTESEARQRMKQEEDLAKAERQKADLEAKQQYQKNLLTEEEYHAARYQNETAYIARIQQIRDNAYATEAEKQEVQNMALDSLINEANYQREQKQRDLQQTLAMMEQSYQADQIALEQQRMSGEFATEEEYNRKKIEAEIDYQRQRLQVIREAGGDTLEAEMALQRALMQQTKEAQAQRLTELKKQSDIADLQHDYDQQLAIQQQMLDEKLISQEQYEQNVTDIVTAAEQDRQSIRESYAQAAQQLMSASSSLFSAMQSREEARVDKKYKTLIDRAKKNGKDTTKLEEQQEQEKLEIKKKYADKQFYLTVLQIISQAALGIQKIWAEWGWNPPVAAGLTATESAVAAIQLATAKAQRDQAAGLFAGGYSDEVEGYTGEGNPRDVAGVIPVHKKEFVINHEALKIPAIRKVADVIDSAQKRKSYNIENTTRILQDTIITHQGFANGGYTITSPVQSVVASPQPSDPRILEAITENTKLLEKLLSEGITILRLRKEIKHQESLESNARR